MTGTEGKLFELRTRGYSLVEGVLGVSETDALRAAIDRLMAEDDQRFGASRLLAAGQRGALRNLAGRGREFEHALGLPVIHQLATRLLGHGYRLHSYDALVLMPDEGRFPWDFHTDLDPLRGVAFPASLTPGLNCLLAVDAVTAANGATWVVPASHRATVSSPDVGLLAELAEQPELAVGDVLLFDARIWHCAGHNTSGNRRRLIKIEFVQPWLQTQMDYPRAVSREVQARLSACARSAIGDPVPVSPQDILLEAERRR
jgi:ectoine hydroxylase-related dioxygenase (phytanoyl-CoA dioxygenase family)